MASAWIVFTDNPLYGVNGDGRPIVATTIPQQLRTGRGGQIVWNLRNGDQRFGIPPVSNVRFDFANADIVGKDGADLPTTARPVNANRIIKATIADVDDGAYPYSVTYGNWTVEDPELDVSGTDLGHPTGPKRKRPRLAPKSRRSKKRGRR